MTKPWAIMGLAMLSLAACSGTDDAQRTSSSTGEVTDAAPAGREAALTARQVEAKESPPADTGGDRVSQYSRISPESCRLIEENQEEAGYWLRRCTGRGGYGFELSESDLRQNLVILNGGRRDELEIARLVTGGAFNNFGGAIEWRGPAAQRPDRLIARVNVANGADPTLPDISKLMIVRLDDPACIVGVVSPGPDQNGRARAIADAGRSDCLQH